MRRDPLLICGLVLLFCPAAMVFAQTAAQPGPAARQITSAIRIRWNGQPGVSRYRLQLARDANFTDIVFDRAVEGHEYVVKGLPSGQYYWRVAPAAQETGDYSQPQPVTISAESAASGSEVAATPLLAPAGSGWRTATGDIARPLAARLRQPGTSDIVGVNAEGTVFALDGASGVALWVARFRPTARKGEPTGNGGAAPFVPVVFDSPAGTSNVVVAFEGGIRALEGATGRELWRASMTGRPESGVAADLETSGSPRVFVVDGGSQSLVVLDAGAGKIVAQSKLGAPVVGAPVAFKVKNAPSGVLMALGDGMLELRNGSAERLHAVKFDAALTTPPLVVEGARGPLIIVGSEKGLLALDAVTLKPLGRVATEGDAPAGMLVAADLDGDGASEIVMVTGHGRVVVVSTRDGKIRWYAGGATDSLAAALADLNGDGVLDVLVPAGPIFAKGLSGRDGKVIWQSDPDAPGAPAGKSPPVARALTVAHVAPTLDLVVGADASGSGLRAVALPNGALKSAVK